MIDFIALALVVLLMVRGWVRGLVREAIDVGTLILAAVLAFRLAPIAGRMLAGVTSMPPDLARVVGGAVLFVGISVGAAIVGTMIHRSIKHLPGLTTINRIGGAALGFVYGAILVVVGMTLISAAPVPDAVAQEVEQSVVAAWVADPDGAPQQALGLVSGDRALQSMIWIRRAVDDWTIDPRFTDVTMPNTGSLEGAHASSDAAVGLFERVNRSRAQAGLDPLVWSDEIGLVATTRALGVHQTGSLVDTPGIEERLDGAGVPFEQAEERLMVAATTEALAEAVPTGATFTHVGIGVVDSPYGLIAAVVFAG